MALVFHELGMRGCLFPIQQNKWYGNLKHKYVLMYFVCMDACIFYFVGACGCIIHIFLSISIEVSLKGKMLA